MDLETEIKDIIRNPLLNAKCFKDKSQDNNPLSIRSVAIKTIVLVLVSMVSATWSWSEIMSAASTGNLSGTLSAWLLFLTPFLAIGTSLFIIKIKTSNPVFSIIHGLSIGLFYGSISGNFDRAAEGIIFQAATCVIIAVLACALVVAIKDELIGESFLNVMIAIVFLILGIFLFDGIMSFISLKWRSILSPHHLIYFLTLALGTILGVMVMAVEFSLIKEYQKRLIGKQEEWFFASGLLFTAVWIYLGFIFIIAWLRGSKK